jgi:serine protease Do
MDELTTILANATSSVIERVQRSLVVLHNGGHGIGAGIIWTRDGLILTNHHVVAARPQMGFAFHRRRGPHTEHPLRVELADGRQYPARLVAQDPEIDLALLQIDAHDLPAAMIADSRSLRIGELVLAVGHPWGQRGMVTAGLVSGISKAETHGPRHSVEIIRSDVRLAPGNSGGPLVNANGAVVGINTMIVGGDLGIAVPSHVASAFVASVAQNVAQN